MQLASPGVPVRKLAISRDGAWLAASGQGCFVGVWNVATAAWREVLPQDDSIEGWDWQTSIVFSPRENLLAAARNNDDHITLWTPDSPEAVQRFIAMRGIRGLAFSPDGTKIGAAVHDMITLWDVATGKQLAVMRGQKRAGVSDILDLTFAPDGRVLASTATDDMLTLWNVATRRQLLAIPLPGRPNLLQFRSSGELMIACSDTQILTFDSVTADDSPTH